MTEFIIPPIRKDCGYSDEFVQALEQFIKAHKGLIKMTLVDNAQEIEPDCYPGYYDRPYQILGICDKRMFINDPEATVSLWYHSGAFIPSLIPCELLSRLDYAETFEELQQNRADRKDNEDKQRKDIARRFLAGEKFEVEGTLFGKMWMMCPDGLSMKEFCEDILKH